MSFGKGERGGGTLVLIMDAFLPRPPPPPGSGVNYRAVIYSILGHGIYKFNSGSPLKEAFPKKGRPVSDVFRY